MLRVELLGEARPGVYKWVCRVAGEPVEGLSREPLLDACRKLKSIGVAPEAECGLFRKGRSDWDLKTTVGYGAGLTVHETVEKAPRFTKHKVPPHWRKS